MADTSFLYVNTCLPMTKDEFANRREYESILSSGRLFSNFCSPSRLSSERLICVGGCSGIHSAFVGVSTSNGSGLSTGPAAVTTVITPLVAPSGTTAPTSVSETRLTFVAATLLNMTA
jgi:hypothetical protein